MARAGWPTPAGGPSASGDPEVLFTFDDGPHERFTPRILDELAKRNIKAIFFWTSYRVTHGEHTDRYLELVRRAVREGHVIGNHTVTHPNLCIVKEGLAGQEIDANQRAFENVIDLPVLFFRAPYGAYCQRLRDMLAERALPNTHWDIDPQEWRTHSVKRTVSFVTRRIARLDGRAIVLMHDTQFATAQALPEILDWIEKENQHREKTGKKPPIRIVDGMDYLGERLDHELLGWLAVTAREGTDHLAATFTRLLP